MLSLSMIGARVTRQIILLAFANCACTYINSLDYTCTQTLPCSKFYTAVTRSGKRGISAQNTHFRVTFENSGICAPRGITSFRYCMKVEPFGYLLALERSLSAAPSIRSVAATTAGSRPARYSRWACKPEAQFQ